MNWNAKKHHWKIAWYNFINSSIKLLLKISASRLASQMEVLISDTQSGFIKGRQPSESIPTAKEVIHSIRVKNFKGMILKLDFEKAFDSVR